jgi:broad specificity phosphatase PhoE
VTLSDLFCPATLVLARHATAEFVEGVFSDEGGTLTHAGRSEAQALAESLVDRRVGAVWSSDFARAVQTAEIVAARLGVAVTTRRSLREVHVGSLMGEPFDQDRIDAVSQHWHEGDLSAAFPGGESGNDVVERHRGQLEEIADQYRGETVLVVGHETALSIAVPALGGLALDWARDQRWANAGTVTVEHDADGWRVR